MKFEQKLEAIVEKAHPTNQEQTKERIERVRLVGAKSYADLLDMLLDKSLNDNLRHDLCHTIHHWTSSIESVPFWRIFFKREQNQATQAYLQILGDSENSTSLRFHVGSALLGIRDKRVVKPLAKFMLKHSNPEIRESAAYAFIWLIHPAAYPFLLKTLNNSHEKDEVRGHAAEALGQLGNKQAVPHLLRLLENDSLQLRWESIFALSILGDKRAIPALKHIAATDNRPSLDPDNKTLGEQAQEAIDYIYEKIAWQRQEQREKLFNWLILVLPAIYLYWRHERFFPTKF